MKKINIGLMFTLLAACTPAVVNNNSVSDSTLPSTEEITETSVEPEVSELDLASQACLAERVAFFSENMETVNNLDLVHKTFTTPDSDEETEYGEVHLTYCVIQATQEIYSEFHGCRTGLISGDRSVACDLTVTLDSGEDIPVRLITTTRKSYGECNPIFDVLLVVDGEVMELGTSYFFMNDGNPMQILKNSEAEEYIVCTWNGSKTTAYRADNEENRQNGFHSVEDHDKNDSSSEEL